MKKMSFLIVLIFAFLSCTSKHPINETIKYNGLKGKVESYKLITYEAEEKFGEAIIGDISSMIKYEFNDDGYLIGQTEYDDDGDVEYALTQEYEGNKLISVTSISHRYFGADTTIEKIEKGKGYQKQINMKDEGDFVIIQEDENDSYHNIMRDQDNNLIVEFFYDKNLHLIKDKQYYHNDLHRITTYEYDEKGWMTKLEQTAYRDDGEKDYLITHTYKYLEFDSNGNWIKRLDTSVFDNYSPDIEIQVQEIKYK